VHLGSLTALAAVIVHADHAGAAQSALAILDRANSMQCHRQGTVTMERAAPAATVLADCSLLLAAWWLLAG